MKTENRVKSYDAFGGVAFFTTLDDAKSDARRRNVPVIISLGEKRWSYWPSGGESGNQEWHCVEES